MGGEGLKNSIDHGQISTVGSLILRDVGDLSTATSKI